MEEVAASITPASTNNRSMLSADGTPILRESKRRRLNTTTTSTTASASLHVEDRKTTVETSTDCEGGTVSATDIDHSVQELLSIPIEIIFREVPSSSAANPAARRKPIMTRSEAHCLLQVAQLAHQVDTLVQLASEVLEKQVICRAFSQAITRPETDSPHTTKPSVPLVLRSILPLLTTLSDTQGALRMIREELDASISGLIHCATLLRQYADQNWTLSESMMDALGEDPKRPTDANPSSSSSPSSAGRTLAREKRMLGELQEELATRIDNLEDMLHRRMNDSADAFESASSDRGLVSMKAYCAKVLQNDTQDLKADDDSTAQYLASCESQQVEASPAAESSSEVGSPLPAHRRGGGEVDRDPWSASSATSPVFSLAQKSSSQVEDDEEEEVERYEVVEMTQGTQNAVAALAGLASGLPG